jgi:hypothetical protein
MTEIIEMLKPMLWVIITLFVVFGVTAFVLVVAVFIKVFKDFKRDNK